MKATLLLLSILLFSAYTFSFSSGAEAPEPVRDSAGKILRTNSFYYILPANARDGGGLTMDSIGDYSCPLGVVQEPKKYMNGYPLKFYPVNLKNGVIRVSTDLNIEFSAPNSCGESNVWKLGDFDPSMGYYFVGVDGVVGNPGVDTLSNWFKIEKLDNAYKLVYCPSVCSYCDPVCKDVGIVYENGKRRLALTDSLPLKIIFKKP